MRSEKLWYRLAAMIFCRGDLWSPAFVCLSAFALSAQRPLHFTNHVGERRNFCFAEIRRPAPIYPTAHALSAQRSAHGFNAPRRNIFRHGTSTQPCDNPKPRHTPNGLSRGRAPGPFARFARWVLLLCVGV